MSLGLKQCIAVSVTFKVGCSTPSSKFLKMIQTIIAEDVQNISVKALLQKVLKIPDCFVLETNKNCVTHVKDQWMRLITTWKSEHCHILTQFLILCHCEWYYMGSKAFTVSNLIVLVLFL